MSDKLKLVKNGVFPIRFNQFGEILNDLPDTGFPFPGTIQGEGKLIGTPSLFIRLSGCNLRCIWNLPNKDEYSICDTPYSSFDTSDYEIWNIKDLISTIEFNSENINYIVITGGEPMLQHKSLVNFCSEIKKLPQNFHLTLETNGTIFNRELANFIDLFSISPKLKSSNPNQKKLDNLHISKDSGKFDIHNSNRINIEVLQNFIDLKHNYPEKHDIQLKFVLANDADIEEIKNDFLDKLVNWNKNDIFLMPTGINKEQLETNSQDVLKLAIANGWNYSSRLHIDLFGDKPGV